MTTSPGSTRARAVQAASAVGLTVVTMVTGVLVTGAGATAQAATVPVCTAEKLRIVEAGSQGAAGTIYHLLRFTNITRASCVMRGYPGVSFTDQRGRQLGVPAGRARGIPVTTVLVRPGASAHTTVGIHNAGNYPPASCRARMSTYLRVYPPGSFTSRLVPLRTSVCTTTLATAFVQAVAAGPGTP
jgi:Protein of unknown function (DUF4232)